MSSPRIKHPRSDSRITAEECREYLRYEPETGYFYFRSRMGQRGQIGLRAGNAHPTGYRYIQINRRLYSEHRLAWLYVNGEWPNGFIDHINCVRNDNRICNLRVVDRAGNNQNRRKANKNNLSTGVMGVVADKYSIRACIGVNGKTIWLGSFPDVESARQAYLKAKRDLHIEDPLQHLYNATYGGAD